MINNSLAALPIVLKDTNKVYENISINLRGSKINLENIKKSQLDEREILRRLSADKLRSERQLCSLEALVLNLQNEIDELEKKNKGLVLKIGHVIWNQNKADLIGNSERKAYERKEAVINNYVVESDIQQTISKYSTNYSKEKEERSRMMHEKKKRLQVELNENKTKIDEQNIELINIEQENKVLQKRNSALLLRLQRLLKETENRRDQVAALLERINLEKRKIL